MQRLEVSGAVRHIAKRGVQQTSVEKGLGVYGQLETRFHFSIQ